MRVCVCVFGLCMCARVCVYMFWSRLVGSQDEDRLHPLPPPVTQIEREREREREEREREREWGEREREWGESSEWYKERERTI